ncbi:MAG: 4-hydroxythreonine-4-phosphate dehydrogenase PdxA [Planctomycetes bacterium]|nr:4-hydroxythreonine-4-phosphate dehydrogenase PdxA [Planctomycetota bacterium]
MEKPTIALTLGDIAGIGPEVVARSLLDDRLLKVCRPVVVGHPEVLRRAFALIGKIVPFQSVGSVDAIAKRDEGIVCWNPSSVDVTLIADGKVDARAGQAAYDYLVSATKAALAGQIDAITTAPLNKAALNLAGHHYPGHTEILASECGVREFAMMLYLPSSNKVQGRYGLGVAHVTLHTSIRSVPDLLSVERITETIGLIEGFLKRIGCQTPRIGISALNPHAGEDGLFGGEEATHIAPAVIDAQRRGILADGPIPADALMRRAATGEFDGVVAMYHDQGHIALKLLGFDQAVNVTLGLPIVRTSPSHGTAFDIAWQGRANANGLIEAVLIAAKLIRRQV